MRRAVSVVVRAAVDAVGSVAMCGLLPRNAAAVVRLGAGVSLDPRTLAAPQPSSQSAQQLLQAIQLGKLWLLLLQSPKSEDAIAYHPTL